MNISANDVAKRLAERAEEVAKYLFPNGIKQGNEFCVGSLNGESGKSLKICLSGGKQGVFCDFATGESGDLLTLWAIKRNLRSSEAFLEAKQYLGIGQVNFLPNRSFSYDKPALERCQPVLIDSRIGHYLIKERKLTFETIQKFRLYQTDTEIVFPFYRHDQLLQIKYLKLERPQGKKQIRVCKNTEPCLFGWQALDPQARIITICEGEIDAMSLNQYGINALSVPFGGGSGAKHKWLEYEFDNLAIFDEIYLCFDKDSAGQEAVNSLLDRLGRHRCRIVALPAKDANECLQQGIAQETIQQCFDRAATCDPHELKSASSYTESVIAEFYPDPNKPIGIYPPWDKATDKICFRPDELSIWSGINGHGKSQFLGQIILASMQQGAKVCIASLELKPQRLLMRLTRQAAGLSKPTEAYIKAIHEWYHDKLWIFDLVGTAKVERLLEVFLYARQRYGIDVFVIDSFMKCGISEEDYPAQKAFIEQLCDFKNTHSCHIHLVNHPRKSLDESKPPGKLDIKGSGAVSDLADNCFTVWRNKGKELQIQSMGNKAIPKDITDAPDCLWLCDKQRNGEWEGRIALWFDKASFQYLVCQTQKVCQYVEFSNIALRKQ